MSYDLGYDLGYESEGEKVRVQETLHAMPSSSVTYAMSPPGGLRPGSPEWMRFFMDLGRTPPPPGPGAGGDTGSVGGSTPVPNPPPPVGTGDPSASAGLGAMGANPANPGSLPSAAPEGTPDVALSSVRDGHNSAEWQSATADVASYYGIPTSEAEAMAHQYGSVAEFRTAAAIPTEGRVNHADLPATGTGRTERIAARDALRGRVADRMVEREGERIYGMFHPGEITRDDANAMAAQMFRRNGVDPDRRPPADDMISRMEIASTRTSATEPSPMDREMTALRGTSIQPPNTSDLRSGLHRDDAGVRSLMEATTNHYSSAATLALAPGFGSVTPPPTPPGYYANNPAGRAHRTADASLYLVHRGIERNPGALRGIARTPPSELQPSINTFASSLGTTGPGRTPTETRRGLETRLASDPSRTPDTTGWPATERRAYERSISEMRTRAGIDAEAATVAHGRTVSLRQMDHELGMERERVGREEGFRYDLARSAANHELQMRQQHDQQLNQLFQNMTNHGMQIMQSQIQHINNLTTDQLRQINQTTTALIQAGSPRPFDIVAQMLGGGGGRR